MKNICILCGGAANKIKDLKEDYLQGQLSGFYKESLDYIPKTGNYELYSCKKCLLEYAMPQLPGSDEFYTWVVKHNNYYPSIRWGWDRVKETVENIISKTKKQVKVLDVGCGSGEFLKYLREMNQDIDLVGVDVTSSSIEKCKSYGLEAYCCDVKDLHTNIVKKFDVITSFHSLEHVANPIQFMLAIRSLLKGKKEKGGGEGIIYVSVPYSPMSIEALWFDPLNNPPHHLTRWNESSLTELGKRIDLNSEIFLSPTKSLVTRTVSSLVLRIKQKFKVNPSAFCKIYLYLAYALVEPLVTIQAFRLQFQRKRIDGKVAPDEIMVRFQSKN
jgi:2-polyprenyl-3-methyl-5-hydroxy-6-metoxy-1,4-benzoquinol methylase